MITYARFFDALTWASSRAIRNFERILIIGPGITDPIDNLQEMYPSSEIVVVEIEGKAVRQLERRFKGVDGLHVVKGDACLLSDFAPGLYDLTIIRHPDVARFSERWAAALASSVDALKQRGLLLVTCYSLPEVAFVNTVLREKAVFSYTGSLYTTVPIDLQGNDRYILIFEKQSR
jgi:hypothetical protein